MWAGFKWYLPFMNIDFSCDKFYPMRKQTHNYVYNNPQYYLNTRSRSSKLIMILLKIGNMVLQIKHDRLKYDKNQYYQFIKYIYIPY